MNLDLIRAYLNQARKEGPPYLREQSHWVILGLVYLVAWWTPVGWWSAWLQSSSLLAAQPLILPGFIALLWTRNKQRETNLHQEYTQEWFKKAEKQEGNLFLFLLGCILYFVAHFVRLSSVAVLGLVLILVGVLFRIYGKKFLRKNRIPILFFLLIIPALPEVGIYRLEQFGLNIYSSLVSAVLKRIGWICQVDLVAMTVQGVSIGTPIPLRGLYGLYGGPLFFLWHGLFFRRKMIQITSYMTIAFATAFLVHLTRFFVVALLLPRATEMGKIIANFNSWPFTILSVWLTFGVAKQSNRLASVPMLMPLLKGLDRLNQAIARPLNRGLDGSGMLVSQAGSIFNKILMPVIWPFNMAIKGFGFLFSGIGKSTQGLENWIKKQERRRQRKREERER